MEGKLQAHRLRLAVKKYGWRAVGRDSLIEKLNFQLGCDVIGLAAVRIQTGQTNASLVTAPGCYFGDPALKCVLQALVDAARAEGSRVILVYKRSLNRRSPPLSAKWRSRARRRGPRRLNPARCATPGALAGTLKPRRAG
jgi:hypothetical protein